MNNFGKRKKSLLKRNKLRAYTSHLQILTDIWRCLNMSAMISSKLYLINQSINTTSLHIPNVRKPNANLEKLQYKSYVNYDFNTIRKGADVHEGFKHRSDFRRSRHDSGLILFYNPVRRWIARLTLHTYSQQSPRLWVKINPAFPAKIKQSTDS